MSRQAKLQVLIGVLMAITSSSLGYELKERGTSLPVPIWVILVASVWLGTYLAPLFSWLFLRSRMARRFLFGSEWIEGLWVVSTFEGEQHVATSLATLSYQCETLDLLVTTWAIGHKGQSERRVSASQVTSVTKEGGRLHYVSVFTSHTNTVSFLGVALGSFWCDSSSRHPNRYEGRVHYMDGRPLRSETARRLSDDEIRKLKKDYPDCWEQELHKRHVAAAPIGSLRPQSSTTTEPSVS